MLAAWRDATLKGWTSARCWALELRRDCVVYRDSHRPGLGRVVARYPLSVTKARRHDWWRATAEDHAWAIPDYPAVAADYDAIHLTVGGYLSTAGRAITAGGAYTVLAGWSPTGPGGLPTVRAASANR